MRRKDSKRDDKKSREDLGSMKPLRDETKFSDTNVRLMITVLVSLTTSPHVPVSNCLVYTVKCQRWTKKERSQVLRTSGRLEIDKQACQDGNVRSRPILG